MVEISLVVALLASAGAAGVPDDVSREIVKAVKDKGEADPIVSIKMSSVNPKPSQTADETYVVQTRPRRVGSACLSRRYAVVVPAATSRNRGVPVYRYVSASLTADCLTADVANYAQIRQTGLSDAEVAAGLNIILAAWSNKTGGAAGIYQCSALLPGVSCPKSSSELNALAPLKSLHLVDFSNGAVQVTFSTAQGAVTIVSVPLKSEGGVVKIDQRQAPPF